MPRERSLQAPFPSTCHDEMVLSQSEENKIQTQTFQTPNELFDKRHDW